MPTCVYLYWSSHIFRVELAVLVRRAKVFILGQIALVCSHVMVIEKCRDDAGEPSHIVGRAARLTDAGGYSHMAQGAL